MGILKPSLKKCPLCTAFFGQRSSQARTAIRFRIAGQDFELCEACTSRKRFETEAWVEREGKTLRTVPQYDVKTRRRTLVVLCDPQDYDGAGATPAGQGLALASSMEDARKQIASQP